MRPATPAAGRPPATIDSRFVLVKVPTPVAVLYLSPVPGDPRTADFIDRMHRQGLPRFEPPAQPSWTVPRARPGWLAVLGPAWQVSIVCPGGGRPAPVVEEIGRLAPLGWHNAARQSRVVVLLMGPHRRFAEGETGFALILRGLQGLNVLAGLVDVLDLTVAQRG